MKSINNLLKIVFIPLLFSIIAPYVHAQSCGIITTKVHYAAPKETRIQLMSHNGISLNNNRKKPTHRFSLAPGIHEFTAVIRRSSRSEYFLNHMKNSSIDRHEAPRSEYKNELSDSQLGQRRQNSQTLHSSHSANSTTSYKTHIKLTKPKDTSSFTFKFLVEKDKVYRLTAVYKKDPLSVKNNYATIKIKSIKDSACTLSPILKTASNSSVSPINNELPFHLTTQLNALSRDIERHFRSIEPDLKNVNIVLKKHLSVDFGLLFDKNKKNGDLIVQSVIPNTDAARIGFISGDRIVSIQGYKLEKAISSETAIEYFKHQLLSLPAETEFTVEVLRNNTIQKLSVHSSRSIIPSLKLSIG